MLAFKLYKDIHVAVGIEAGGQNGAEPRKLADMMALAECGDLFAGNIDREGSRADPAR